MEPEVCKWLDVPGKTFSCKRGMLNTDQGVEELIGYEIDQLSAEGVISKTRRSHIGLELKENSPAEQHNASQDADEQIAVAQEEL